MQHERTASEKKAMCKRSHRKPAFAHTPQTHTINKVEQTNEKKRKKEDPTGLCKWLSSNRAHIRLVDFSATLRSVVLLL